MYYNLNVNDDRNKYMAIMSTHSPMHINQSNLSNGRMMNIMPALPPNPYIHQPFPSFNTLSATTTLLPPPPLTISPAILNIRPTQYLNVPYVNLANNVPPIHKNINNNLTMHKLHNPTTPKSTSTSTQLHSAPMNGAKCENESVECAENVMLKSSKNPWFNEEIALVVKEHRKASRRYHRSKSLPKKEELKQIFKALDKKKRKLIKAAKQKYLREVAAKEKNEEVKSEGMKDEFSGYMALGFVQSIGGMWRQWTEGKHWKYDVDELLESTQNEDKIEIVEWLKDIKCEWFAGKHWKVDIDELLQSTKATQEQHLFQLFGFIKDGIIAYYKYQIADPLL